MLVIELEIVFFLPFFHKINGLFRFQSQELSTGNDVTNTQKTSLSNSYELINVNPDNLPTEQRRNHRKNRQAPKPPIQTSIAQIIDSTSNLEIRGPSELLLGFPTGLQTQWRHTAEALVNGSVKYEVNVRIYSTSC